MRVRAARRAAARLAALAPPPDQFDEANLREDVRKMLLRLSPRQRAALVLLDMYVYSSKEAAHIMRIRPSRGEPFPQPRSDAVCRRDGRTRGTTRWAKRSRD